MLFAPFESQEGLPVKVKGHWHLSPARLFMGDGVDLAEGASRERRCPVGREGQRGPHGQDERETEPLLGRHRRRDDYQVCREGVDGDRLAGQDVDEGDLQRVDAVATPVMRRARELEHPRGGNLRRDLAGKSGAPDVEVHRTVRIADRAQRKSRKCELVEPRELTLQGLVELVTARQRRLVRFGVERDVNKEVFGGDRRSHAQAKANGEV